MIATEQEMLVFITYAHREWYKKFEDISYKESLSLRKNFLYNQYNKKTAEQILTAYDCVKIRPEVYTKSVWTDGLRYNDENFFLKEIISIRGWYKKIGWSKTNGIERRRSFERGTLTPKVVNKILETYGFTCVREAIKLPAIWEMVPLFSKPISRNEYIMNRVIYNPEEV
jgi:hypothetical protein